MATYQGTLPTNGLEGNPFANEDALYTENANNEVVVKATLAVAYEQRTANLIAHAQLLSPGADLTALVKQITERLGVK